MPAGHKYVHIRRQSDAGASSVRDAVIDEQAITIALLDADDNDQPLVTTLATPTEVPELITGFLHSEGFITRASDIVELDQTEIGYYQVRLLQAQPELARERMRLFLQHAGCGLCSAKLLAQSLAGVNTERAQLSLSLQQAQTISEQARARQSIFQLTGGGHAAALATADGEILHLSEDVGRHNALDKLIGWALRSEVDFGDKLIWLSGRAGFELVQKSARTAIGAVLAIGAPSALAIELARAARLPLLAFLRARSVNIYNPGH